MVQPRMAIWSRRRDRPTMSCKDDDHDDPLDEIQAVKAAATQAA